MSKNEVTLFIIYSITCRRFSKDDENNKIKMEIFIIFSLKICFSKLVSLKFLWNMGDLHKYLFYISSFDISL